MSRPRRCHLFDCPVEIINELVLLMGTQDSVALASTCKLLRQVALRQILRSVYITSNRQAQQFCKGITDKCGWTSLVRAVCLEMLADTSTSKIKIKSRLGTHNATFNLITSTPERAAATSLLTEALQKLPNLRTLVIHEDSFLDTHDILSHSTLPALRSFTYYSRSTLSRPGDFVLRHPLLTDLSLQIWCPTTASLYTPTKKSLDSFERLSHLTSFNGPCFLVPELFNGRVPLTSASIAWDSPCYPAAMVDDVLNSVAASSGQTLVDLNCAIFMWMPDFIPKLARALPNLKTLSISQQIPWINPSIKAELMAFLPKFTSLRSFSLNTTFPDGIVRIQDFADCCEHLCDPLKATCPSLEMCNLYHDGKPEEEVPRVLQLEPVDLTEIAQRFSA